MPQKSAIVAIGASSGGVDALRAVAAALPADLNAAVLVVLHIGAHRSDLPWLLARCGALPAAHGVDGEMVVPGRIYVAPPDHHMVVENDRVVLTKGPRENWARPAIDPLFRSVARCYGSRAIGVIMSGGFNDGTAGLYTIKQFGGISIVQDPFDCVSPNMPQSAIANVQIDHVVPAADIGLLIARVVAEFGQDADAVTTSELVPDKQQKQGMTAEFTLDAPVAVTCPDCGGALRRSEMGTLIQFSCHIGHVYTAEVMLAAQFLVLERFIEQAMRSLSERAELCRQMLARLDEDASAEARKQVWRDALQEAIDQTAPLRTVLTRQWLHPGMSIAVDQRG